MNLQALIQQQTASVKMLEKLVRAGRSSQTELDKAKARLVDLQAQEGFVPLVQERTARVDPPLVLAPAQPIITGDEYARLQAEMGKEADRLNRQMADLSNQLQHVPEGVACPQLTSQILALKGQIETIWDRKRYLERNRSLPPDEQPDNSLPDLPGDDAGKFELAYAKRRLIDLRSKLKKKLTDPKARPSKVAEWEQELAQCELKIQELEFKLS